MFCTIFPTQKQFGLRPRWIIYCPTLFAGEYAVVGGLAIRYFIESSGQPYPRRPFNDIDIIVKHRSTVRANIIQDFKVAHFHDSKSDYYWAIVDPVTKMKADIFSWPASEPHIITLPVVITPCHFLALKTN